MKRFTIIFSVLLVLGFAGMLAYVNASPDFVPPAGLVGEGEDPDAPVWDMTMDDMLDYLEEKGFLKRGEASPLSAGIGTDAYGFDGAEIYWWDLDDLEAGSNEEAAYRDMAEKGTIDLWQQGQYFMAVTKNGPFGLAVSNYNGNSKALLEVYSAFGQTGGAGTDDRSAPVWSKSMDDLAAYLKEEGFIASKEDLQTMASGIGTDGRGFDGAEIYWWDVENLEEGSDEAAAFASMNAEGIIDVYGSGSIMPITPNGPFGLAVSYYEGDPKALEQAFKIFGRE